MYCTKEKSFVSTQLQDITIFNGNNSSQLEDITSKSRTKLAQTKSKDLVQTLISEALSSDKSWDEIKDLLCLKICNSDIHTSVSRFMEIQQNKWESLAGYIHRYKREAHRCNFDNNANTVMLQQTAQTKYDQQALLHTTENIILA